MRSTTLTWRMYIAPAGLEHLGVHEGDRIALSLQAEALLAVFELPMGVLSQLGPSIGTVRGEYQPASSGVTRPRPDAA